LKWFLDTKNSNLGEKQLQTCLHELVSLFSYVEFIAKPEMEEERQVVNIKGVLIT
jgi:hypothetical protein